ncbi:MAG TPA: ECF-type sigma factor [Vicinamibacterales bacterium]|nr:ECF-type sigma factor [Vicinamibacterales bacterium]
MADVDVSVLVDRWASGDRDALDEMLPAIYGELRRLAAAYLRREGPGHTLQPTALVHEAYFALVQQRQVDWHNRAQFLGVAAGAMKRVLLHHAERRHAGKREGDRQRVTLDEALAAVERSSDVDVLDLHNALDKLAVMDGRQARIVELRVFGGLTIDEVADVVGVSPATVKRDWDVARLFLRRELA